jgi:hypothetical protein
MSLHHADWDSSLVGMAAISTNLEAPTATTMQGWRATVMAGRGRQFLVYISGSLD